MARPHGCDSRGRAWRLAGFSQQCRRPHKPHPINGDRHQAPPPPRRSTIGDPQQWPHTATTARLARDATLSVATTIAGSPVSLANDQLPGIQ